MDSATLAGAGEQATVGEAVSALAVEFPDVDEDLIGALVRRAYRQLAEARIRDYVPVLVTKEVRATLRHFAA